VLRDPLKRFLGCEREPDEFRAWMPVLLEEVCEDLPRFGRGGLSKNRVIEARIERFAHDCCAVVTRHQPLRGGRDGEVPVVPCGTVEL
jgi:hypothetical protein